ncbi:MAG: sugar O-acetyltransferase, partial [Candidatus Accumulibacter sp.]|nr:sugar O-acetyltransferase [Accumulibacter sp.]
MTEKEKAAMGLLYDANDDEDLVLERLACKELCHDYNMLRPAETGKRIELIHRLLAKTKSVFWIEQPFFCDYGYNIEIGENFYA